MVGACVGEGSLVVERQARRARRTCNFCAAAISAKPQPGLTTVKVLPNFAAMPSAAAPNVGSPSSSPSSSFLAWRAILYTRCTKLQYVSTRWI